MSDRIRAPEPTAQEIGGLWGSVGESRAREGLILHYSPLVKFGAGWADQVVSVPDSSLRMFGQHAIDKFEPERNIVQTYAVNRIRERSSTSALVRRAVRPARDPRSLTSSTPPEALGDDDELAAHMGLPRHPANPVGRSPTRLAALDELSMLRRSLPRSAPLSTQAASRAVLRTTGARYFLSDAINRLPERERLVITLYYYEGLTLAEIGDVLGVTESRICQIHTKSVMSLRNRMAEPASS
jgi:RNA polymerase sigma factor for flagellar operon FliA